ncbi:hypothetical protein COCVIDRAFT_95951 [Bipolaris victoriae FI3]|uniref:Uncharacterized protein n=1 Tax=Bipolaris victoriae (strain FI3) TaxID=930091 RepID=W7ECQ5_BIPV3|nr:hypothetical protein COCVIDRAFT_95951 [Bipolaris victoriae FI3]
MTKHHAAQPRAGTGRIWEEGKLSANHFGRESPWYSPPLTASCRCYTACRVFVSFSMVMSLVRTAGQALRWLHI